MHARRIYNFGSFSIDVTAKVLLRDGEPVRLSRKAVETLLVLVESSGRVLTKEELIAAVWPDRVVDEANLTQNIAVVRKALGAERGSPGYIETFAGRGYRLVGPVTLIEEPAGTEDSHGTSVPVRLRRSWLGLGSALFAVGAVIVAASIWFAVSRRPAAVQTEFHRVPVTRFAGKEYQPAVSPDGISVAFVWEQGPQQPAGIWVQTSGESSPRRVSGPGAQCSSPTWSPDGNSLAYFRFSADSAQVVIAPARGGEERAIARLFPTRFGLPNRHLDWSPDGKSLVVNDSSAESQPLGLFLLSIATGERRRLTEPAYQYVGDVDPRFSPDGKWIAFTRAFNRAWQELFVMPAAGGNATQITADGRQVSGHDWARDGQSVVFGSNRDGEFKVWKVQPAAAAPARTMQTTGIYADYPLQLSVARRSPVLVYSVLQQDRNIWRLDLKASPGRAGAWSRVIASPVLDASPQYSPDGARIVFRSDRSGEEQLWVAAADGSNPVQITQGRQRPSVGRWSPDGRSIVFNNSKDALIFVASAGPDGQWTVRETGVMGVHPVFSTDGTWIYAGRKSTIVRMPAAGGETAVIGEVAGISLGTSADGRSLYFVQEPAGTALWSLDTASKQAAKVIDNLVPYCSSCWAVAPSGIYYLGIKRGEPGKQALYFHEVAAGRDRFVMDYPEPLLPIGSGPFSLSPDGRYLLCVRMDPSNADITTVQDFR